MKKIGEYTMRGVLDTSDSTMDRLTLFDGRFDTAYKVTSFTVSFRDRASVTTESVSAKLSTENLQNNKVWNWDDNREIAWASAGAEADARELRTPDSIIDPDNMIVEDLFIGAYSHTDSELMNYIIELEKYDISEWQGALAMVRNKSQA